MAELSVNVVLADPSTGAAVCFEADTSSGDMPKWAVAEIGDHAWKGGKAPRTRKESKTSDDGNNGGGPTPPPLSGQGSGVEAWAAYAIEVGVVDLPAEAKRDEIVEAIKAAGHPVEPATS